MDNKILHLVLKQKWYDMIASGVKTEEYREIKPYYESRLLKKKNEAKNDGFSKETESSIEFKNFDIVRFYLGYKKDRPSMDLEFKGFVVGQGNPEWGAEEGKDYFIIKLGNKIA